MALPSFRSPWMLAAAAGALATAWCVYFDYKRRSSPGFKKRLRQKRAKQAKVGGGVASGKADASSFPDMHNYEAVQKFFIQELQLGEELLSQNEVESAVEHLSNAVAVCGQPQQILGVLQQTLPQSVFHAVLQNLPIVSQRIAASISKKDTGDVQRRLHSLEEDDVE